mmetsp:Transcript_20949/g.42534  ORF Transcript_20949/g.42534 Transcript_20949/m.42534 type:complete len:326 (-) Transcript_20949:95-1072(-)
MRYAYVKLTLFFFLGWTPLFSNAAADCSIPGGGALASGDAHSCTVDPLGPVSCWGRDLFGESTNANMLRADRNPSEVVGVACGAAHTCLLLATGSVECYGYNGGNETDVPAGQPFARITAGTRHNCALTTGTGEVVCWGLDADFRLDSPPGSFTAVESGSGHNCAIQSNGSAVCWGFNNNGQADSYDKPAYAPSSVAFLQVSCGMAHSCGVLDDGSGSGQGSAVCWGGNSHGQTLVPTNAEPMTMVSAGSTNSCGVRASDGAAICWGGNTDGESTPPAGETWQYLSCGDRFCCGVKKKGSIQCWGLEAHVRVAGQPALVVCAAVF